MRVHKYAQNSIVRSMPYAVTKEQQQQLFVVPFAPVGGYLAPGPPYTRVEAQDNT